MGITVILQNGNGNEFPRMGITVILQNGNGNEFPRMGITYCSSPVIGLVSRLRATADKTS